MDWPALIHFQHTFTGPVPASREDRLEQAGIAAYHGRTHFIGPATVEIQRPGRPTATLAARRFAIAAGAMPARLGIPGEELLLHGAQFLVLPALPRGIAFVGGGYVSFEFAHIAARSGAEVTILHGNQQPLANFDPDLVRLLVAKSDSLGIQVILDAPVTAIEAHPPGVIVRARDRSWAADLAVMSQQIIDRQAGAADGGQQPQVSMGPVPVVLMQPGAEFLAALPGVLVKANVGPFA
jgi:glutathione reductase (NADPH)